MILNANELSPDQKAVIERLIGRRVLDGEAVSVRTFSKLAFLWSGGWKSRKS
jgi:hypothetical protein